MQTLHENIDTGIRIQVDLLDSLMNLAVELVFGRNQLLKAVGSDGKRFLEMTSQRIDLLTSEIQEQIMRTPMQPTGILFNRLPCMVQDLVQEAGKQVDLSIMVKAVEIDKSIMEAIKEPLVWMVRKAVSQGIEFSTIRQKLKKPQHASLEINASHEAGQVVIEVVDEGKGIVLTLVHNAVQKGLLSDKQGAEAITEPEKMGLVFWPDLFSKQDAAEELCPFAGMAEIKARLSGWATNALPYPRAN